ncbi:MAG: vWA domain-containing protein [Myxococcota bacterium]
MRVAFALLFALFAVRTATAQQASYGQYLVVLDDSGSMDQSDPRRLVVMASLALTAGLEDGDQVMLVGLNELAGGTVVGPEFHSPREILARRDAAEAALPLTSSRIRRLGTHDGQTPCRGALDHAQSILNAVASAGAPQTLLLLTDGACNGGSVEAPERWLSSLRSHRDGRFRFALLVRDGAGRPDRRLQDYATRTGWNEDTSVAFDARALLRAFANVLSFSRGLRYDDGGRVGLARTFAGARNVRSLAISEGGISRIHLERFQDPRATPLEGGPTFRSEQAWSLRVARGGPEQAPYAVRSSDAGVEVLVIPVYGRLRIEGVVAPCGSRPPLPWTSEWAVRAGQPACAYARLVGDAGDTIVPGQSFDFQMDLCADEECAEASAMQPDGDGTFNAVLGDLPLGRHERTFRAHEGALAFPVVERRGFAAVSFGVHHLARAENPSTPVHSLDLGVLPRATPDEVSLVVTGSFPNGARGQVRCEITGAAAECLRCVPTESEVALQDRMTMQLEVEATPFCEPASTEGELPIAAQVTLAPVGGAAQQLTPHVLPVRGTLRYAAATPVEVTVEGGSEATSEIEVPAPAALLPVVAVLEEVDGDLEVTIDDPGSIRAGENGRAALTLHAEAEECCSPKQYEARVRLSVGESVLHVPVVVTVTDPGFWVCPFRRILRWSIAAFALLFLIWLVRGFLSPAKFRDGALILYADSHERLLELREGDDGYRKLRRFVETKRGFRRNAGLYLGGPRAPLPSLKRMPADAFIEALAGGGTQLVVTGPGVERFSESKGWHELEAGTHTVSSKIQLRRDDTYLEFRR